MEPRIFPRLAVPCMSVRTHPFLLPLEDLEPSHLPLAGAKNVGLGALAREDLRIPTGFALTSEAFHEHLSRVNVHLENLGDPRRARQRILDQPLEGEGRAAVLQACEKLLRQGSIAARSSLYPFEDDPRHSCAGLFVSKLNLQSEETVARAVVECFASLLQESTLAYFERNGLALADARMSVGLQSTIDAVASATVFTRDPVTQNERLVYVDATHGFGGVTNSALIEPDGFFIEKGAEPRIIARRKGTKRRKLVPRPGGGLELRPNTSMDFALDDDTLIRISRDASLIESRRGRAQDIELAVTPAGDIIYLQVRPQHPLPRGVPSCDVDASNATAIAAGGSVVFGSATARLQRYHHTSRNADAIIVKAELDVHEVPKLVGTCGLVVRHIPPTSHPAIHLREIGVPTLSVGDSFPQVERHLGSVATLDTSREPGCLYSGDLGTRREVLGVEELPPTRVGLHLLTTHPSPIWTAFVRESHVHGVHVRGESVNNDDVRTHPLALVAYDDERIEGGDRYLIERRIAGYPDGASFYVAKLVERLGLVRAALRPEQTITYRLTDLQTPDYARLVGGQAFEKPEQNPALGLRGAARMLHSTHRRVLDLELKALCSAISRHGGRHQLLVPMVRAPEELAEIRRAMQAVGLDVPLGMMVETPASVLLAEQFAELADFFCVGGADLTQLVNGADRTHDDLRDRADPMCDATLAAVRLLFAGIAGRSKDVLLPEPLWQRMVRERHVVSNNRLHVYTWPDRLLRVARALAETERHLERP